MGAMAPQITCLTIIYSTVDSGADQRKHQCSTSPAFLREYHRWPVNSPHKRPVTRKMFPFDDVFMTRSLITTSWDPSSELYTCWPCPRQFTSELTLVSLWEFHNIHKVCLSLLASSRDRHHRTYTESVNLYRNFCLSLYPFHDLGHIAEFEDWTIMAGWYFYRMLLLLELVAHMLAYNDTDQCPVCRRLLIQNRRVPWHQLLKNTTYNFSASNYRHILRVMPNNSFASAPYIQVCISDSYSMFAPNHWETALLCNDVSHWLDVSLKSVLL